MIFTEWQGSNGANGVHGFGQENGGVDAATLTGYIAQIQAVADEGLDRQAEVAAGILMSLAAERRDAVSRQLAASEIGVDIMAAADLRVENMMAAEAAAKAKAEAEAAAAAEAAAEAERKKRNIMIGLGVGLGVVLLGGIGIALMARRKAPAPEPRPAFAPSMGRRRRRMVSGCSGCY